MPRKAIGNGYGGNPLLPASDQELNLSAQELAEYIKCVNDPIHFIENYVKIVHVDKGIVPFKLYPFQADIVKAFLDNRFVLCKLARQSGKALDIETDIPTINGWKKLKDICVGDVIFGADGKPTTVTYVTETMYDHTCYNITFDTGDSLIADAGHKWAVRQLAQHENIINPPTILTTEEILRYKNLSALYLESAEYIQYSGDTITDFVIDVSATHIPEEILQGSIRTRFNYLRKLLTYHSAFYDEFWTDISSSHESFCDDLRSLLSSLCVKSQKCFNEGVWYVRYKSEISSSNYRLHFSTIEEVPSVPVRCLTVDNTDHLFVSGRNYIPSHNSSVVVCGYFLWYVLFHPDVSVGILANKEATAIELLRRFKQSFELLPNFLKQGIEKWGQKFVMFANNSRVRAEATSASAVRGDTFNCVAGETVITIQKRDGTVLTQSVADTVKQMQSYPEK